MIKTVSSPSSLTYDRTSGISVVARTAANAAPATTRCLHHLAFGVHWTAAASCCICAMRRAGFSVRIMVSLPVRFPGCINRLAVARESPSTERLRFFSFLASCCHPFWLFFYRALTQKSLEDAVERDFCVSARPGVDLSFKRPIQGQKGISSSSNLSLSSSASSM